MEKMKKLFFLLFILILIASACSSNHSTKNEKSEHVTISSKDKSYTIKDKFPNKVKDIEVIKLNNDGSENITNKGIIKRKGNNVSWKGVPDKYKNLENLLGNKVKYTVTLENGNHIEKELIIKYK
ncbi:hypothetical protein ACW9HJ_35470 [Nocardia gipuzkoensis]